MQTDAFVQQVTLGPNNTEWAIRHVNDTVHVSISLDGVCYEGSFQSDLSVHLRSATHLYEVLQSTLQGHTTQDFKIGKALFYNDESEDEAHQTPEQNDNTVSVYFDNTMDTFDYFVLTLNAVPKEILKEKENDTDNAQQDTPLEEASMESVLQTESVEQLSPHTEIVEETEGNNPSHTQQIDSAPSSPICGNQLPDIAHQPLLLETTNSTETKEVQQPIEIVTPLEDPSSNDADCGAKLTELQDSSAVATIHSPVSHDSKDDMETVMQRIVELEKKMASLEQENALLKSALASMFEESHKEKIEMIEKELAIVKTTLNEQNVGSFSNSRLLDEAQVQQLNEWYGNKSAKWNLVYCGSVDGFDAASFHSKCDSAGELVVVISSGGYLFGGYSSESWAPRSGMATYSEADCWLFTLKNPEGIVPSKIVNHVRMFAIARCSTYLCTFGGGHDLHIASKCNENTSSYANIGHSYYLPGFTFNTTAAQNFLCGSRNFAVDEIEVFARCK